MKCISRACGDLSERRVLVRGRAQRAGYVFMIESYASPSVRVAGDTVFDFEVPDVQLSGHVFEEGGKVPVVGARISLRPSSLAPSNGLVDGSNTSGDSAFAGCSPAITC